MDQSTEELHEEPLPAPTPVYDACASNDVATLRHLLQTDASCVNEVNPANGLCPLHIATVKAHIEVMSILLQQDNIDVEKRCVEVPNLEREHRYCVGHTALRLAVVDVWHSYEVKLALCRMLTAHGAGATIPANDSYYEDLFFVACERGPPSVVECLLEQNGARVSARDENGRLPHYQVIGWDGCDTFRCLLERSDIAGVIVQRAEIVEWALRAAVSGSIDILRFLYDRFGADIFPDNSRDRLLSEVLAEGNWPGKLPCIAYLINKHDCRLYAIADGSDRTTVDAVVTLVGSNCDFSLHGNTSVLQLLLDNIPHRVVTMFNRSVARYAFEVSAHPFFVHVSAIVRVASSIHFISSVDRYLTLLLEHGFDPTATVVFPDFAEKIAATGCQCLANTNLIGCDFGATRKVNLIAFTVYSFKYVGLYCHDESFKVYKSLVSTLLSFYCGVNATSPEEASPLFLLLWRPRLFFVGRQSLLCIYEMLIAAGADLLYRRADSAFASPEAAMVAACTGNAVVLARIVVRTGLNVATLLADLAEVRFDKNLDAVTDADRRELRACVGDSVLALLAFVDKSARVCDLIDDIDWNLRYDADGGDSDRDGDRDGNRESDSESADSASESGDDESESGPVAAWRKVRAELKSVSSLKHLCRHYIVQRLQLLGDVENQKKVEKMEISATLKDYLLYDDLCMPFW